MLFLCGPWCRPNDEERWPVNGHHHQPCALPPATPSCKEDSQLSSQSFEICFASSTAENSQTELGGSRASFTLSSDESSSNGSDVGDGGTGYQSDDEDTADGEHEEEENLEAVPYLHGLSPERRCEIVINTRQMTRGQRFPRGRAGSKIIYDSLSACPNGSTYPVCPADDEAFARVEVDASDIVSFALDSSAQSDSEAVSGHWKVCCSVGLHQWQRNFSCLWSVLFGILFSYHLFPAK